MSLESTLLWSIVAAAAVAAGSYVVHGAWHTLGALRLRRAGPPRLSSITHVLWRDPGNVAALDLVAGPGGEDGRPAPPFVFVEEHTSGSQPCVTVRDGRQRRWRVKWGNEVHSETFAVRIAWACGFFAETTHFVHEGTVTGVTGLQRASSCIDERGHFTSARFELDDPAVRKHFEEHSWAWNDNPFLGSRELQGLKIVTMLLSNWDTKDRRDVARGSNTAIFEYSGAGGSEARYLITDWGGSMGSWGAIIVTRGRWDPAAFAAQTPQFVSAIEEGVVKFGYAGQRTEDIASGISPDDVRWVCRYLGQLTDAQLVDALNASGATPDEREGFRSALRDRINQLRRACGGVAASGGVRS
jgi:hypothetical protein